MRRLTVFLGLTMVILPVLALADRDEHRERGNGVAYMQAAQYPLYQRECGSCHLAYPPRLLPDASWQRIMDGLADHFGDNAELAATDRDLIRDFLRRNAGKPRSESVLKITELRWFRHEHDRFSRKMVQDNKDVGRLSRCEACHTDAPTGHFRESRIRIPGYGRWDD